MFELYGRWRSLATIITRVLAIHFSHRVIYAGLAGCHAVACFISEHPGIYGSIAALYMLLALKG